MTPIPTSAATTFTIMLSNESDGYLIDKLIAEGYGSSSLYEVIGWLEVYSGDAAIPESFLQAMADTPSGSDVHTADLSNFSGLNNPVGASDDGTIIIAGIYGRDYFGVKGIRLKKNLPRLERSCLPMPTTRTTILMRAISPHPH